MKKLEKISLLENSAKLELECREVEKLTTSIFFKEVSDVELYKSLRDTTLALIDKAKIILELATKQYTLMNYELITTKQDDRS